MKIWIRGAFTLYFSTVIFSLFAQSQPSSKLYHELLGIKETKRVLYVAAHPDDENTRMIAYLSNGLHAEVAYLSLTRGDGGQNLLGPQLGVELGQIRTQELLKARSTDGGRQFFTRATDFGFSKNPDETLKNWTKEEILSDVVWTVRKFRPDIIINRFNTTPGITHGHHTTSAILSLEAFELAADPNAFPEQLQNVETWQPKRIFWNAYNFRQRFEKEENEQYDEFPVGDFNHLLGETYSQIASDSRTMHKSQGFGSTPGIGKAVDYLQFLKGEPFEDSAFEGVVNRWTTITNGEKIEQLLETALEEFDFLEPWNNVPVMLEIKQELAKEPSDILWLNEKRVQVDHLIMALLGIEMELNMDVELVSPGDTLELELILNNPSPDPLRDVSLGLFDSNLLTDQNSAQDNVTIRQNITITLPRDYPYSQPYWLEKPIDGAMYDVDDQNLIGKPFNDPNITGNLAFTFSGQKFEFQVPLMYKYNDRVDGEIQQPVTVVPEVNLNLSKENIFLLPGQEPEITVSVAFQNEMLDGELRFEGLNDDEYRILEITDLQAQKTRNYQVAFVSDVLESKIATAQYITGDSRAFGQTTERISYKHIPNLTYFRPASVNLIKADWELSRERIGYIEGAGDDVPQVLEALGYDVDMIDASDLTVENLSQYKAVVVGIRAYNTNPALVENQQSLMGYVRAGGTVVTQYNTTGGLLTDKLGPFDFELSRTRVTVQESPVVFEENHPVFSYPNQIEKEDFDGWVQERGLYFVGEMADQYDTPLVLNEPGEDPTNGSLLYAKYGEGTFIYTGISFFRQLPAGVAGATKLFVNMIEQ
ncbi:PIG-L family deacetylase [Algoriphagus sediminis]|uniref:PIG-L family deacetylase n=1 Tax=Algoriphagus sediminis TaxID=3057113 RepID=A0ABT7YAP6_9BACT|nr:PIG-L family deacetylase [Algoriphagus sediminis]MDN3203599.1 PIG-L family deacetylase [Algoriphagus sediminis]